MANIFRWDNQCLRMSQLNWYNTYSTSTRTSVTVEESSWSASSVGDKLVTCSFCQWPSAGRMRLNGKGWDETREPWGPEGVSMLRPCPRRSAVPPGLLEAKHLPSIVPNLQVFRFLKLLPYYCSSQSCWNCWNNPLVILPHLSFNLQLSPLILISITFLKKWFFPFSFRMFCRFKNICFLFDQHLPVLYLCLQTQPPACTPTLTDSILLFSGFMSHFCLSLTLLQSLFIYPLLLET